MVKVFCVGFRAGSQSMKAALERLGYRTYGMGVVVQYYSHLRAWTRHAEGDKQDLQRLLARFDATVGMPANFFVEDMLAAFPEARVVLQLREDEAWWRSYSGMASLLPMLRRRLFFVPRMRAIYRCVDAYMFSGYFQGKNDDREYCIQRRDELFEQVRRLVPPERVLVHNLGDGWEPLCEFLDHPVPGGPFPHVNKSEAEVKKRVGLAMARDLGWLALAATAVVTLGLTPLAAAALGLLLLLWFTLYDLGRA